MYMLIEMVAPFYRHPMFWWLLVPLMGSLLLVVVLLWESRIPRNLHGKR